MISHTQGWLHCDIPGTDASGVVKSLMDMMHARVHQGGDAEPRAHHHLLLPDQLRRPGRHLDQRAVHQAAEDQPRSRLEGLRAPRGGRALPGRGDPAGDGQRQAVAGSRRKEMRVLRRLLSAVPADADQRRGFDQDRGLGRRQALQRPLQADFPQAGHRQPAQQSAALAGGRGGRAQDPLRLQGATPAIGSAWASGSSASAGRASSS